MWGPVFKHLPHLKTLNLCDNPNLGKRVASIVSGLRCPLERLYLNNTGIGDNFDNVLEYFYYNHTLTGGSIKELTLDSNLIYSFGHLMWKKLPSIEILSLGNNYWNPDSRFFLDVLNMFNLRGLNISRQHGYSHNIHKRSPHENPPHLCQSGTACPIELSPNLEWVDVSFFGFQIPEVPELVILRDLHVKYVNVASTGLTALPFVMFCPVGRHIQIDTETLDFSGNAIKCVNSSIFANCSWNALKHLMLGQNYLGLQEPDNVCGNKPQEGLKFLQSLPNLETIDLRENYLSQAALDGIFRNNPRLKHIDLSKNRLSIFNVSLDHLEDLDTLNLRGNSLKCLTEAIWRPIDELQRRRKKNNAGNITLDLSHNPLICDCTCLPFYSWLAKTGVNVVGMDTYQCSFSDNKNMSLHDIKKVVVELEYLCHPPRALQVAWSFAAAVAFVVTSASLVFRYDYLEQSFEKGGLWHGRWNVREWKNQIQVCVGFISADLVAGKTSTNALFYFGYWSAVLRPTKDLIVYSSFETVQTSWLTCFFWREHENCLIFLWMFTELKDPGIGQEVAELENMDYVFRKQRNWRLAASNCLEEEAGPGIVFLWKLGCPSRGHRIRVCFSYLSFCPTFVCKTAPKHANENTEPLQRWIKYCVWKRFTTGAQHQLARKQKT